MSELKPCPFCGSNEVELFVDVQADMNFYREKCMDCGCTIYNKPDADSAELQWNSRATDPRLKEAVEEIETWIDELQTRREDKDGSYVCYLDGQIAGLAGALYYLEEHLPELKEDKDG